MIVRGTTATESSKKAHKTYLRMIHNVQLTGSVPKITRMDNPVIRSSVEDARRLHHPHVVREYNMHRVLVDNGSSADILYYLAFQQIKIDREQLIPTNAPLVGFGGTKVFPLGAITISIMASNYLQQITWDVIFLVVNCSSAYNAILGRPTLNS